MLCMLQMLRLYLTVFHWCSAHCSWCICFCSWYICFCSRCISFCSWCICFCSWCICFCSWCICFYLRSLVSFFLLTGAGEGVWFSLRGITYHNNSLVALEDIGENDSAALLCETDQTACCRTSYAGDLGNATGNWFFPNGDKILNETINYTSNLQLDFYRTRGQSVVRLHRRRGGVTGIYRCEIPNKMNVTQNLYVRVYTNNTGECMTTKILANEVDCTCQYHFTCLCKHDINGEEVSY